MATFRVVFFNKPVSERGHFSEAVEEYLTHGLRFMRKGRNVSHEHGCHIVIAQHVGTPMEVIVRFEHALKLAERFDVITATGEISNDDPEEVDALVLAELAPNPIYELAHELGIIGPL